MTNIIKVEKIKACLTEMGNEGSDLGWVITRNLIICERLLEEYNSNDKRFNETFHEKVDPKSEKSEVKKWVYEKTFNKNGAPTLKPFKDKENQYCLWDKEKKYGSNQVPFPVNPEKLPKYNEGFNKLRTEEIPDIKWYKADDELIVEMLTSGKLKPNHAVILKGSIISQDILED